MKIENAEKHMCDYGCNHIAKYKLDNGKLCCSESTNACPAVKAKNAKIKYVDKICPHCHKEFKQINVRVFANHVRWCKENPKHDKICGNEFKTKLANTLKLNANNELGEFCDFEVECANEKCKKHFFVKERKTKFPEKERYFCSITCAHSFVGSNKSEESKQKTSKTLKNKKHVINCCDCGKEIEVQIRVSRARCEKCKLKYAPKYSKSKFVDSLGKNKCQFTRYDHEKELIQFQELVKNQISDEELSKIKKKVYRIYRVMCGFTFSLKDYPDEFDTQLLKEFGMYSATNHGNNKNGISRDHMYSCADGFKNNVSPLIISHPANCQLMTQHKNASKRHNSSITLEQLLERIKIWEQKYGKYEKKNVVSIPKQLFERIKDAKICHPMNFDGYKLIYEISTLKMKWWNVKELGVPNGWTLNCPLEIRESKKHYLKQ